MFETGSTRRASGEDQQVDGRIRRRRAHAQIAIAGDTHACEHVPYGLHPVDKGSVDELAHSMGDRITGLNPARLCRSDVQHAAELPQYRGEVIAVTIDDDAGRDAGGDNALPSQRAAPPCSGRRPKRSIGIV